MNEIFNEDGHISDYGFKNLLENKLNRLNSLEVAEHLSFCDSCIERYTELLSSSTLLSPSETFTALTLKKIKEKTLRILYSKYFSAAIAASFAIFFWVSGVFNVNLENIDKKIVIPQINNEISVADSFSAKFNSAIDNFSSIVKNDKKSERSLK